MMPIVIQLQAPVRCFSDADVLADGTRRHAARVSGKTEPAPLFS